MKSVNLLPQWYLQQNRRQSMLRLHVVVMLLMGAGMCGATWIGRQKLAAVNQQRDLLTAELAGVKDVGAELKTAQANLRRLDELRLARKELGTTVPMSAVIQQLQNAMSRGMALSNVSIDVRSEPVKGTGFVGDPHNPPKYHDIAHLNVLGISPNDKQITDFIEDIARNPLFSGVTLDFTRTAELQKIAVRKFEIQLDMDLERLTAEDPGNAVATAMPAAAPVETGEEQP